ncbi:hypothetical protein AALP_AA3G132700 [Arabis alpina]|uniref:Uncharacterized protein n=1 Tax=Arabis alpina TaxID=50452 RepID=A0A087H8Y2_ARAAL|nr:hypothetical protein AALP_AA3G132700 [Arabis alpina]
MHGDSGSIIKYLPGYEGPLPFELETGYIGVGDAEEDQLFYYFIKSESKPKEDPLLVWLTGGPGCSSFSGLVYENGPLAFKAEAYNGSIPSLVSTTYSWTKVANIIYLDQPVGAGFSYSTNPFADIPSDKGTVKRVDEFVRKWLAKHPEYFSNPFYVTGNSYSGKVIPAIVQEISNGNYFDHDNNSRVPFAHGMALISEELYESMKSSCGGIYVNVDPLNTECLKLVEEFKKCVSRINPELVLESNCDITSPDCYTYRLLLSEYWANNESVRKALKVVKGTTEKWERCNYNVQCNQDIKSTIPHHKNNINEGYRSLIFRYIGVGDAEEDQLFYYFVKSQSNPKEDPLLVWLTGGPGCSSFSGLVYENGPLTFKVKAYNGSIPSLVSTTYAWTKVANIIYLDQPVGAGFSYSTNPFANRPSDKGSVKRLDEFVRKWLAKHPEYFSNPFYVTGNSYSGKVIPAIVQEISNGNYICCKPQINLQGYVLGNPVTDFDLDNNTRVPFAHGMALISDELYESMKSSCGGIYVNVDPLNTECLTLIEEFKKLGCLHLSAVSNSETRMGLKLLLLVSLVLIQHVDSRTTVRYLPGFDGPLPFELETGYIGVGEGEEEQMFYYFIKSESNPKEDPLLIYLNGGPGCSSISGLLLESGPVTFKIETYNGTVPSLVSTTYSWTKVASIIYLDQPVGTGFSYSRNPLLDPPSDTSSIKRVTEFIHNWLTKHPEFFSNPFYVTGNSYAGLIIPEIVQEISNGNCLCCKPSINLQGYMLGNPVTEDQRNYRIQFAHRMALISDELYESLKRSCKGNYFQVDPLNTECLKFVEDFNKCISKIDESYILAPKCKKTSPDPCSYQRVLTNYWANDETVRKALGVKKGSIGEWVRCYRTIPYKFEFRSAIPYHKKNSIEGYRSLIFSGDHDMQVPFIATQAWIRSLNYSIIDEWRPWMVHNHVAGYTRTYANKMTHATVKGGGHSPEYKLEETSVLFKRWIHGQLL